jgi:erythromycin esterase-like protein
MLFDFLVWVNTGKQSRAVNQLAELVVSGEWYQANGLFKGRKAEMLEILSGEEYECIDLVLRYAQKINKDRVGGSIARDSMMFERSRFLIEHLGYNSERIFLCGQVSHLNLASSYPNPIDVKPLGKALKDRYGGEYMCYLLSVSSGNTERYGQDFKIEDRELQLTPEGSLEYSLMERKYLSVYVPITRKLDRLLLTRWGGLFQLEQEFYPMNLYSRYNGLFFVTDTVLNTPKRNTDIMVKDINRQKYRKKIMCEILSNGKK